jgi:hypothetical protein
MATVYSTTSIHAPRAAEMSLHPNPDRAAVAFLDVASGAVYFSLNREDPEEARAQAEAMARLAELATQAEAWLRGGDLPGGEA